MAKSMETKNESNREFYKKYCQRMIDKLKNSEDKERMEVWLEWMTNDKCVDSSSETSYMYLELLLWALHTNRINVFPFKHVPPVDHGDIDDSYKFALEIVQLEPEEMENSGCGEVKTVVTDDLKEYFAVQDIVANSSSCGTHCFFAFSRDSPISQWRISRIKRTSGRKDIENEPEYWMRVLSRPPANKFSEQCDTDGYDEKEDVETKEDETDAGEDKEEEDKDKEESNHSTCPDLKKIGIVLQNLSFGERKMSNCEQDGRNLSVHYCPKIPCPDSSPDRSNKTNNKCSGKGTCDTNACVSNETKKSYDEKEIHYDSYNPFLCDSPILYYNHNWDEFDTSESRKKFYTDLMDTHDQRLNRSPERNSEESNNKEADKRLRDDLSVHRHYTNRSSLNGAQSLDIGNRETGQASREDYGNATTAKISTNPAFHQMYNNQNVEFKLDRSYNYNPNRNNKQRRLKNNEWETSKVLENPGNQFSTVPVNKVMQSNDSRPDKRPTNHVIDGRMQPQPIFSDSYDGSSITRDGILRNVVQRDQAYYECDVDDSKHFRNKSKGGPPKYSKAVIPQPRGRNTKNNAPVRKPRSNEWSQQSNSSSNQPSERKLKFSEALITPQLHKPTVSGASPLKSCLRNSHCVSDYHKIYPQNTPTIHPTKRRQPSKFTKLSDLSPYTPYGHYFDEDSVTSE